MSEERKFDPDIPSPDSLAGIYICAEGKEEVFVRPRQVTPQPLSATPVQNGEPTKEQLAGIYICIEGPEEVYVEKSKPPKQ